ncbi:MAG: UvrD-helicase domain-containing protein [Holosporaceae bacterium]|jgi:ATP-dependent helicase/nuclease subunit A|nr:UvrD-helicase domain-containing protein [Holosporaceae bacterium]
MVDMGALHFRQSDACASEWISASAGTGKTKSLIDRIVLLLLSGVQPSKILCLTYTKAAAAEMSTRLSDCLQKLSEISDEKLKEELYFLKCDEFLCGRARDLYEQSVINSQVSIQTIHSFCFKLLEQFPLETGLYPGIRLCTPYQKKQLMDEAIAHVLAQGHTNLEIISEYTDSISDIWGDRLMDIVHFINKSGDFKKFYAEFFNVDVNWIDLDSADIDALLFEKLFYNNHRKIFAELAKVLETGGKNDKKKADILKRNASYPTAEFMKAFLTEEGMPPKRLCSTEITEPNFSDKMRAIAEKALSFSETKKQITSARVNTAFFTIAEEIIGKFRELKALNHCLDFDDVILQATDLLKNGDWVRCKIDGGVDHMLIDEAQDTSPEQWEAIKTIAEEFFTNYRSDKTIFAVGDEKQSIYSFQGANVKLFGEMQNYFKERAEQCEQKFRQTQLNTSFRTTGNILSFVDAVFAEKFTTLHATRRSQNTGVVEIVDLFEDDAEYEPDAIENDLKYHSAEEKLSFHMANLIEKAIKTGVVVESRERSAQASDFLILFQRRDPNAMRYIISALKKKNIPVTGIDKISLDDELIVEDLIALAEFSVFPLDDLMCARVLKSPVVGMTEEELMEVCLARGDNSLWEYIKENPRVKKLQNYVKQSSELSVYDFFMYVLMDGTKEQFIGRLGEKCLGILNEFLALVMEYEKENTPSVQSFLEWFRSFKHEVKRESFAEKNTVRLMTVHAAKGLQSPFVILADAHFTKDRSIKLLNTEEELLLWNFSKDFRPKQTEQLFTDKRIELEEESYRLLYVAMTRAEDFLYILGKKQKNNKDKCWYNFVCQRVDKFKRIESEHLYRIGNYVLKDPGDGERKRTIETIAEIPSWYYKKLPPPEDIKQSEIKKSPAAIYGDCVHLLLNEMPRYLNGNLRDEVADLMKSFNLSETEKEQAQAEALKVMKKFDFLFDAKSLAEVSFMYAGKEGRIDKIAFRGDDLWIVDFKTGLPQKNISPSYIAQLNFYKEAIGKITCHNVIRTAILWTQSQELVEI